MTKTSKLVLGIVVVLAVVGGFVFFGQRSHPASDLIKKNGAMKPAIENVTTKKDSATTSESSKMVDKQLDSRYVTYSPSVLDGSVQTRRVLFFYANWCPTCRPADESFKTNQTRIPMDVTLIRVNYNDSDTDQSEKELARKYGITYQHTFVQIDKDGKKVSIWNGGQIDELLKNIK